MAFGYTYTLPTISGSHSDFPVLLKEIDFPSSAIDGTANAIDNGGGNLRAYTDSGKVTKLSVEVVAFVSSGSPDAEVWVKIPTASTGNTIFLEADSVATTQPAVTAPFGRNSVWDNYESTSHDGGNTDSKSGLTMVDDGSGSLTSSLWGAALTAPKQRFDDQSISDFTTNFTVQFWQNGTGDGTQIARRDNVTTQWQVFIQTGNYKIATTGDLNLGNLGVVPSGWNSVTVVFNSPTDIDLYLNGSILTSAINRVSIASQSLPTRIGYRGNGGLGTVAFAYGGLIGEVKTLSGAVTSDFISTEYDNQSSVSAWGSVGAWVDSAPSISIPVIMNHLRNQGIS